MKKVIIFTIVLGLITYFVSKKIESMDPNTKFFDFKSDVPKCDDEDVKELVLQTFEKNIESIDSENRRVEAIFTVAENKELKSCECEGTIPTTIVKAFGHYSNYRGKSNPAIKYKAQRNSEGNLTIRMESEMPQ